ncbi:hypothetical protein ACFLUK_03060 [Chloroflexota bacterium]
MDVLLRVIAIFIEVVILSSIIYVLLAGVRLTLFDLGLQLKYKKILTMALVTLGSILVIFFIAHLTSFYPTI